MSKRKKYSPEFKREAVELARRAENCRTIYEAGLGRDRLL